MAGLGAAPVAENTPVLSGEIDWGVRKEGASCVEDVVYRRTRTAVYEPEAAVASWSSSPVAWQSFWAGVSST